MYHGADWNPLEALHTGKDVSVEVWGRTYTQQGTAMLSSLVNQGREVLAAPIRLTGEANGEPIVWEDEGCYLLSTDDESAIVNGYAQSQCLILNSSMRYEYDGSARWDVRILPRGLTVPQLFNVEPRPFIGWNLTKLALEIPLRKEGMKLYNTWRDKWDGQNGVTALKDGAPIMENGAIPEGGLASPFLPSLWLGDENAGLALVTETDEFWQTADPSHAVEIADGGDCWIVKLHLLDSLPRTWENPAIDVPALSYSFGLTATPVKPFRTEYLNWNAVHIDCFTKVLQDYWPFISGPMSEENPELVIDRLCRAGVNLLILHEKWNTMQNNWNVPVRRAEEIHKLVKLCHQRGIRVIPYFGYEITSTMPEFTDVRDEVIWYRSEGRENPSGWYRVPYQRANRVCYHSSWADKWLEGMLGCLDQFHFDGVYLDGTTTPCGCSNHRHGCGYTDAEGKRHDTYPIFAYRNLMKKLCERVHARGGIVNPHPGGATIPFISGFCDLMWDGEHLQTRIRDEGLKTFSLEYFRAEYLGRNFGVPVQFIVYEFPGVWDFDMALSVCMIHGVYPRPNAITHPLDVMEKLWSITGTYGISSAQFRGYWENQEAVEVSDSRCKASFYEKKQLDGSVRVLLVVSNPTTESVAECSAVLKPEAFGCKRVVSAYDAMNGVFLPDAKVQRQLDAYTYGIYEIVLEK